MMPLTTVSFMRHFSLALSFPAQKRMDITYLHWLQSLLHRFLHTNEEPRLKEQPFTLVVTEEILHEYASVLLYPHIQKRHQLLHSHIERFIILIRRRSLLASSSEAGA